MLQKLIARALLVFNSMVCGAGFGILLLKLKPRSGMGFDAVGDAIGALALGIVVGALVGGVASAVLKTSRSVWIAAGLAGLVGLPLLVAAARIPQNRVPLKAAPEAFRPHFAVQMFTRIAAGEPGPPAEVGDFRYRELKVSARDRSLFSKGWGPAETRAHCYGTLDDARLSRLAEMTEQAFAAGIENCPQAGAGTFSLTLEWQEATLGVAGFGLQCDHPQMDALLTELDRARQDLAGSAQCP